MPVAKANSKYKYTGKNLTEKNQLLKLRRPKKSKKQLSIYFLKSRSHPSSTFVVDLCFQQII